MAHIKIEGKPQLFFSYNNSDKPWRLIEKIVAVVESFFQKVSDLYAFSPARIPNVVGDPTEVDVAYSNIPNPTDFFEFIQVRDREDTQGRPWVEQTIGQYESLGITQATMVSTESFSQQAIRLAKNKGIHLRLLLPENNLNIKKWYKPDSIGVHKPLAKIDHAIIFAKSGNTTIKFTADTSKCTENNILYSLNKPNHYKIVSLSRVFEVEVMLNSKRSDELLNNISADSLFHNALLVINFTNPRFFLKVAEPSNSKDYNTRLICPITNIAFYTRVSKQAVDYPISHRHKYIDAFNNECIAQVITSEAQINSEKYYICLVRHNIDNDNRNIGGAFFQ